LPGNGSTRCSVDIVAFYQTVRKYLNIIQKKLILRFYTSVHKIAIPVPIFLIA
jgi:hypothetical protein